MADEAYTPWPGVSSEVHLSRLYEKELRKGSHNIDGGSMTIQQRTAAEDTAFNSDVRASQKQHFVTVYGIEVFVAAEDVLIRNMTDGFDWRGLCDPVRFSVLIIVTA